MNKIRQPVTEITLQDGTLIALVLVAQEVLYDDFERKSAIADASQRLKIPVVLHDLGNHGGPISFYGGNPEWHDHLQNITFLSLPDSPMRERN